MLSCKRRSRRSITAGNSDIDTLPTAARAVIHTFDPRNITTEPEYYVDIDVQRYALSGSRTFGCGKCSIVLHSVRMHSWVIAFAECWRR